MPFIAKDVTIYDELWDIEAPLGTEHKGEAAVMQDTLGFLAKDAESVGEEIAFIYRCRQVEAAKRVGTGEAILAGDRLYAYRKSGAVAFTTLQNLEVSPVATGTAGTDYMFCGWAKKDAGALDATVLMNFDGTRQDETI